MRTTQSLGLTGVASGETFFQGKAPRASGAATPDGQNSATFAWARALSRRERCSRADHHDDPQRIAAIPQHAIPGRAAAIFAAESVGLRGRQPERPRLDRPLS